MRNTSETTLIGVRPERGGRRYQSRTWKRVNQLTSFSSLVLIQESFRRLDLKERLRRCFEHPVVSPIFGHATVVVSLVLHLLMGFRELRDIRYYANDPSVRRIWGCAGCLMWPPSLGAWRRPTRKVSSSCTACCASWWWLGWRRLISHGSPWTLMARSLGTGTVAEGTAAGFNRKKKGQRSHNAPAKRGA